MALFNFLRNIKQQMSRNEQVTAGNKSLIEMDCAQGNFIDSLINTPYSKARFEDGKVYLPYRTGEMLIGHYDDNKVYNATHEEIGNLSENDDYILVQLHAPNTIKYLHVVANMSGYIEEVQGEYRTIAYLQNRLADNPRDKIIGMAAAFVCLQAEVCDEQNEYSYLYASR